MGNFPANATDYNSLFPAGSAGRVQLSNAPEVPADALDKVATYIVNYANIAQAVGLESAVPSETAHIDYLAEKQVGINEFDELDDNDESAMAWRGVLAILALHKLYGFDLQVVQQPYIGATVLTEVYRGDQGRGLNGHGFIDKNNVGQDIIYVLQKKGASQRYQNLALLSKKMILCPFRSIDEDVLQDVPWYDSKQKEWRSVVEYLAEKDTNNRCQHNYFRSQFQLWLNGIPANPNMTCYNALMNLNNAIKESDGFIQYAPDQRHSSMSAFNGANVCSAYLTVGSPGNQVKLLNVPEFSVTLPSETEFMSSDLLIVPGYDLGDLREKYSVPNTRNDQNLVVLLPISKVGVNFLEKNPTVTLENVKIDGNLNAPQLDDLKVTCSLRVDDTIVERKKTYSSDHIHAVWNFPLLSLWPNVRPVCNGQELWKRYYVSAVDFKWDDDDELEDSVFMKVDGNSMKIDNSAAAEQRLSAFGTSFRVGTFDHFPQYVHMMFKQNGAEYDVGCVYNRLPAATDMTGGNPATAAVDFGTSNSICVLAESGMILQVGEMQKGAAFKNGDLFNGKRISRLYRWDEVKEQEPSEEQKLSEEQKWIESQYDDYLGKYWLSDSHSVSARAAAYKTQKVRSIAIRYPVNGGLRQETELDGMVDGRMYVVDDWVLKTILSADKTHYDGHIHSAMKKASLFDAEGAGEEALAAALTVTDLAVHCALEAMMAGASSLRFRFSYPDLSYKNAMDGYWYKAIDYLRRITGPGFISTDDDIAISSMLEGEAAARYFLQGQPDGRGAAPMNIPQGDFAVIDIGGGTSDFTLWTLKGNKATARRSMSLRFAGDQLIAESLLGGLRPEIKSGNMQAFKMFGETDSTFKASPAGDQFINFMTGSSLDSIYTTVNGLIPSFNRRYINANAEDGITRVYKGCQKLIQIRIALVFYVLQRLIEETRSDDPEFCKVDNPNYKFHIYLAGGGSQAFQMCRSTFCNRMIGLLSSALGIDTHAYPNVFQIHNAENADKLEVVHGMVFEKPDGGALEINTSEMAQATEKIPVPDDTLAYIGELQETCSQFRDKWLNAPEDLYLDKSIDAWFTDDAIGEAYPLVKKDLICEQNLVNTVNLVQTLNHIIKKMSGLVV